MEPVDAAKGPQAGEADSPIDNKSETSAPADGQKSISDGSHPAATTTDATPDAANRPTAAPAAATNNPAAASPAVDSPATQPAPTTKPSAANPTADAKANADAAKQGGPTASRDDKSKAVEQVDSTQAPAADKKSSPDASAAPSSTTTSSGSSTEPTAALTKQVCVVPSPTATASHLSYMTGFRSVELLRLPLSDAVQDLFPDGQTGWDADSDFGVSKGQWDGSWALSKDGRWDHFSKTAGNSPDIIGERLQPEQQAAPVERLAAVAAIYVGRGAPLCCPFQPSS